MSLIWTHLAEAKLNLKSIKIKNKIYPTCNKNKKQWEKITLRILFFTFKSHANFIFTFCGRLMKFIVIFPQCKWKTSISSRNLQTNFINIFPQDQLANFMTFYSDWSMIFAMFSPQSIDKICYFSTTDWWILCFCFSCDSLTKFIIFFPHNQGILQCFLMSNIVDYSHVNWQILLFLSLWQIYDLPHDR